MGILNPGFTGSPWVADRVPFASTVSDRNRQGKTTDCMAVVQRGFRSVFCFGACFLTAACIFLRFSDTVWFPFKKMLTGDAQDKPGRDDADRWAVS